MKKTQLSKAIAFALTGAALSMGAVSNASATTTTMYNMSTGADGATILNASTQDPTTGGTWHLSGDTDGWANGANTGGGTGTAAIQTWAGTASPTTAAFGNTSAHLNWGLEITGGQGGTAEISTFDSKARYGSYADIDTAQGAWSDNISTNVGVAGGWRHDLDTGLFKSDATGLVTLSATGILNVNNTQFGFTIFQGQNTNSSYGHHGSWNSNTNNGGLTSASLPGGGTNLPLSSIVAYSVGGPAAANIGTISFNAIAGQVYTIVLGGYRTGDWNTTTDGYKLTVSQVPVPGAAWLFGGAIASLIGANRRKRVVPA